MLLYTPIELDDALFRKLQQEAIRRGRSVVELAEEGIRKVLGMGDEDDVLESGSPASLAWFGILRSYAKEANGKHSLEEMRQSIARGREGEGE